MITHRSSQVDINKIIKNIFNAISIAGYKSAKTLSKLIVLQARVYLYDGISKYKPQYPNKPRISGNLGKSIIAKKGVHTRSVGRWDIIIDENRAPYALWIEYGRNNSTFSGYNYMEKALEKYSGKEGLKIVETKILLELKNTNLFR